ncbi:phospholipase [Microbacterium marmarense]|uniref:Phospholipase n=1 Tax=Microbacterium marmarense TaxID=3122051 RepID=A0ABU8LRC3_9MICO
MTATRSAAFGLSLSLLIAAGIATATPATAQTLTSASTVTALADANDDAQTLDDISVQAQSALDAANATLTAAATVVGDVAASDLELDTDDTSIDTTALRDYIEKFDGLEVMPLLILPGLTADTVAETELVQARADELSGKLADAEEAAAAAKKAAEEAAAKAAAEQQAAEAAAAEAEAAAAEESAEQATGTGAAVAATGSNSAGDAQAYAQELGASQYGWGADQFSCLVSLWNRESGWNYQAYNASSGAFGIPQSLPGSKMASAGADWQTNAATQVAWGLGYISAAYGTPCGAWSHSESVGWY